MKKGIVVGLFLIFIANVANAVDVLWSNITDYTSTKADKTVPVTQESPIRAITSASTCKAYVNNTLGTGVTIPANTFVDIKTPSTVSNIVFACTSSAGTTVTVIK